MQNERSMDITTVAPRSSAVSRQGDWYLVQCKTKQDERAEENLIRQGYECARPVCSRERLLRGKRQLVQESLFPGYLFIHMPLGANWAPLRSSRGVARVVAFGGQPLPVSQQLVEQLQARALIALGTDYPPGSLHHFLHAGVQVGVVKPAPNSAAIRCLICSLTGLNCASPKCATKAPTCRCRRLA